MPLWMKHPPGEHALPMLQEVSEYCRLPDFSNRSLQALEIRLGELRSFARNRKLKSIKNFKYLHLAAFTAEFNNPSVHVRKCRVWTLRQSYHFLPLHVLFTTFPMRIYRAFFLR
jgi:hypothetical protein